MDPHEQLVEVLREAIVQRLGAGESLELVQSRLAATELGLSEDELAGLWLFAWSYASLHQPPGVLA
jgi:hypothetical protein